MSTTTELYLVLEVAPATSRTASDALTAALRAAPFSSVLIDSANEDLLDAPTVKPLIELAQKAGIAALVSGDAALARIVKADGVHLPWSKDPMAQYAEARSVLGERYIVGADAGRSRHHAMSLGEAAADYVAFGIPAHVEDRANAQDRQIDLIEWWSEIFEIPCVAANVAGAEQAELLARAGADFVTMTLNAGASAADATALARAFATAVKTRERVA